MTTLQRMLTTALMLGRKVSNPLHVLFAPSYSRNYATEIIVFFILNLNKKTILLNRILRSVHQFLGLCNAPFLFALVCFSLLLLLSLPLSALLSLPLCLSFFSLSLSLYFFLSFNSVYVSLYFSVWLTRSLCVCISLFSVSLC